MTKKTFSIIHDLGGLSEDARAQYLRDASEYFKLDPDLNGLDLIWMNAEDGLRKLTVYCRRGTAEILRDIHGIDVIGLEQHDGPGYVSFKATGKNPKGRQEIAVGASATEGLKGIKLADSVATAQTKALRRLTLQFVGGGLLDVSEVESHLANIASAGASLAQLAGSPAVIPPIPPQVAPNTAPGRDITVSKPSFCEECAGIKESPLTPRYAKHGLCQNEFHAQFRDPSSPPVPSMYVNQEENLRQVYAEGAAGLAAMPIPGQHSVAQNPPKEGDSLQEIAAKQPDTEQPKKRRGRPRRPNQVDISSPGQTPSVPPATAKEPEQGTIGNGQSSIPALAEPVTATTPVIVEGAKVLNTFPEVLAIQVNAATSAQVNSVPTLTKEQNDSIRARLRVYYNEIFIKGGMTSSDGIGGPTMKTRAFARKFAGVDDVGKLTMDQWDDLFDFLDSYTKKNGEAAIVAYVDKELGVAK